jgi:hypothetical protein
VCEIVVTTSVHKTTYGRTLCVFNMHDEELGFCFLVNPLCSMVASMVLISAYLCHLIYVTNQECLELHSPLKQLVVLSSFSNHFAFL